MGIAKSVQAIREDIAGHGRSKIPFATVERIIGSPCTDDDAFETAISTLVGSVDWADGYEIDWIDCFVTVIGPWEEPDN